MGERGSRSNGTRDHASQKLRKKFRNARTEDGPRHAAGFEVPAETKGNRSRLSGVNHGAITPGSRNCRSHDKNVDDRLPTNGQLRRPSEVTGWLLVARR